MSDLKLTKVKSLYKPVEVEIDGKTYQCRKLTKAVMDKIATWEKAAKAGDMNAGYEEANYLFQIPTKELYELDAVEIGAINDLVLTYLYSPKKLDEKKTETAKNVKGSGDKN